MQPLLKAAVIAGVAALTASTAFGQVITTFSGSIEESDPRFTVPIPAEGDAFGDPSAPVFIFRTNTPFDLIPLTVQTTGEYDLSIETDFLFGAFGFSPEFNQFASLSNYQFGIISENEVDFSRTLEGIPLEAGVDYFLVVSSAANPNDPTVAQDPNLDGALTGDYTVTFDGPNFLDGQIVPEPATLGLLSVAGLGLLRRRK